MLKRKSIVLSDIGSSNKKAVLSLEENGSGIIGTVRLYNFSKEPDGVCSLGLFANQKVTKAGLTLKSHMFYDFFLDLKEIPEQFSCAIINFQNAVATPILFGSSSGNDDNAYGSIITDISKDNSMENTQKVLDENDVDFDESEKAEIEKEIDEAICEGACANCVYKKYFYENEQKLNGQENPQNDEVPAENDEIEPKVVSVSLNETQSPESENEVEKDFYGRLKPQIEKLFEKNPAENALQNLIPSSRFVRVEFEDDGDFYVFGLLYDEQKNVRYVCYGVPAVFDEEPPSELAGYPIWLPLDKEKGFGYWLTYQDAATGEPVKAIIE